MPECKTIECCDLDDYQMSSSGSGNCPTGWSWDGVSCVRDTVIYRISEDGMFVRIGEGDDEGRILE